MGRQIMDGEIRCLLCGAEVGQIVDGRFVRQTGVGPLPRRRGLPRCPACGGSLFLEAATGRRSYPDADAAATAA